MLSELILPASTFLARIAVFLLIRVHLLNFPAPVLMLKMVLPSVSIATFLRLLVLYFFLQSFHLTSGPRLPLWLYFSLTDNPLLFFTAVLPTSVFLAILPVTATFDALDVSALFYFLLVNAQN